jgi:hypothetical protein
LFARSFLNTGNKEEEGAANAVQVGIDGLIEYGIPPEEAMAIGYQAYQDARAENGVRFGGVTIDSNTLDKHFAKYAQSYESSKQAENNYTAVQNAAIKERARLLAEKEKALYDFTREAKHANISGSRFDTQEYISRFSNGASTIGTPIVADNAGTPAAPKSATGIPTQAAVNPQTTNPTIGDVLTKFSQNNRLPTDTGKPLVLNSSANAPPAWTQNGGAVKQLGTKKIQVGDEVREGGTPAWRNFNRGNLKESEFTKKLGSIGKDANGFAIFPDQSTGDAAQEKLLFGTDTYLGLSLSKAIERYAPKSDKNDTESYKKEILSVVDNKDKKMSEYSEEEQDLLIKAIRKREGYKAGKVTNA